MNRKKYSSPTDATEITRQVEMLMLGITMADSQRGHGDQPAQTPRKRRTLDDMRRLSEQIKKVPVYTRK